MYIYSEIGLNNNKKCPGRAFILLVRLSVGMSVNKRDLYVVDTHSVCLLLGPLVAPGTPSSCSKSAPAESSVVWAQTVMPHLGWRPWAGPGGKRKATIASSSRLLD